MMMFCLLAAAAAAAAAHIGGNISYLHVPCLTSGRYITLHYPLAAVYVACLFSCLMTRYMSTYLGKVVGYSLQVQPVQARQYLTLATGKSAMVHQTPPLPFLSFSPSQRHVSSRPRVGCKAACAEKEKNKTSLATLHRVYHSLFFWYRYGKTMSKKTFFYLFETREREKNGTEVESPRLSTNYSTRVVGIVDIEGHSTD